MAYPVSLKSLILRAQQRANLEGASAFITPPEWADLANGGLASWYDEVRGSTWGGQYYRSSFAFVTESNRQLYPLPRDFLSLTSLDITLTDGMPVICARDYQEEERNRFRQLPYLWAWTTSSPIFYQIQKDSLSFIPTPQGQFNCVLNYVPTAPKLEDPDDEFDSINGWEEYIVLHMAIRALTKDGQMDVIPLLQGQLETERQRIKTMAPRRDMQSAERVHMIENEGWEFDGYGY